MLFALCYCFGSACYLCLCLVLSLIFLLFFLSFFLPMKKVVAWRISFAFPGLGGVSGSVWYGMVIPGVVA